MKAFSESHPALTAWAGLILLFDGEVWRNATLPLRVQTRRSDGNRKPRRAQPNRYPDFGPGTSLPPSRSGGPVAVGVCNPLQWRNRPRFSRGSLTPGCGDDGQEPIGFQRTMDYHAAKQRLQTKTFDFLNRSPAIECWLSKFPPDL